MAFQPGTSPNMAMAPVPPPLQKGLMIHMARDFCGNPTLRKPWEHGPLAVHKNGRCLCNGEVPFFWLGDTAWLLFNSLNLEDSYRYLKNRADKGFTVIQIDCVHRPGEKNLDGDLALPDNDFSNPDPAGGYWKHARAVVAIAEELGLYIALLPAWGAMVRGGYLNETNAEAYADFLAKQFGGCQNVLWLIGGDVRGDEGPGVFHTLAAALKSRCPGQLMGFHPFGRTASSMWFHNADWLDFNMFQSGHRRYDQTNLSAWDDRSGQDPQYGEDNWRYVEHDLSLSPTKPTADGEPSYEQIVHGLHDNTQPYWQSRDVRRYAYWAVFAGAMGHTYGDNAVMQFYRPGTGNGAFGARQFWFDAMDNPGADQMGHLRRLMEAFDYTSGSSAQQMLAEADGEQYNRVSVFAGPDFMLCYDYSGRPFSLNLERTGWAEAHAWWFNPATGGCGYLDKLAASANVRVTPPRLVEGPGDWVLVVSPNPDAARRIGGCL